MKIGNSLTHDWINDKNVSIYNFWQFGYKTLGMPYTELQEKLYMVTNGTYDKLGLSLYYSRLYENR